MVEYRQSASFNVVYGLIKDVLYLPKRASICWPIRSAAVHVCSKLWWPTTRHQQCKLTIPGSTIREWNCIFLLEVWALLLPPAATHSLTPWVPNGSGPGSCHRNERLYYRVFADLLAVQVRQLGRNVTRAGTASHFSNLQYGWLSGRVFT